MWVAGRRDARLRRVSPFAGKVFAGRAAVRLAAMAPDAEDAAKMPRGKNRVSGCLSRGQGKPRLWAPASILMLRGCSWRCRRAMSCMKRGELRASRHAPSSFGQYAPICRLPPSCEATDDACIYSMSSSCFAYKHDVSQRSPRLPEVASVSIVARLHAGK
ncbi:hypothetical protein MRB53_036948 [Persea americana]|nr:hypothetical protein MRB53_036948 [Persea americana]